MSRRIIISEDEKKDILSKYYSNNNLVVEQFDKTTAVYTTMNDNTLKKVTAPKEILIPKGTKVWHNFKGGDTKINLGNTGVYYDCAFAGYDYIFLSSNGNLKHDNLAKVIRNYFCDGKKMKTWQQVTGTEKKTSSYVDCGEGPYKKGCKDPNAAYRKPDPNGIIYKLQGCLGIQNPDSFFGTNTEKLLLDKTTKTSITKDEIDRLCSGGGEIGKQPSQSNIAPDIDNEERPQ